MGERDQIVDQYILANKICLLLTMVIKMKRGFPTLILMNDDDHLIRITNYPLEYVELPTLSMHFAEQMLMHLEILLHSLILPKPVFFNNSEMLIKQKKNLRI